MRGDEPAFEVRHLPLCLAKIRIPFSQAGKRIRCPACGKMMLAPMTNAQKLAVERAKAEDARDAAIDRAAAARARADAAEAARECATSEARAAAPTIPMVIQPRAQSPFAWGFGIFFGLVFAGILFFVLQLGCCGTIVAGAFAK